MRKFLTGVLTTAVFLLSSGVAFADANGSVALNKWSRTAPTDGVGNVAAMTVGRTVTKINRGQTMYFPVVEASGTKTVQDGVLVACTVADPTTGCASAPIHIAAAAVTVCLVGDLEDATAGAAVVDMYICSSELCTAATSVKAPTVLGPQDECSEYFIGNLSAGAATVAGSAWIYVNVSTAPATGETALVWLTANP